MGRKLTFLLLAGLALVASVALLKSGPAATEALWR